jgi:hypothetical protein
MRAVNKNEIDVAVEVATWRAAGLWKDEGRIVRVKWGREYWPTQEEIAKKCALFRSTDRRRRHGAHARHPRGGQDAMVSLANI